MYIFLIFILFLARFSIILDANADFPAISTSTVKAAEPFQDNNCNEMEISETFKGHLGTMHECRYHAEVFDHFAELGCIGAACIHLDDKISDPRSICFVIAENSTYLFIFTPMFRITFHLGFPSFNYSIEYYIFYFPRLFLKIRDVDTDEVYGVNYILGIDPDRTLTKFITPVKMYTFGINPMDEIDALVLHPYLLNDAEIHRIECATIRNYTTPSMLQPNGTIIEAHSKTDISLMLVISISGNFIQFLVVYVLTVRLHRNHLKKAKTLKRDQPLFLETAI